MPRSKIVAGLDRWGFPLPPEVVAHREVLRLRAIADRPPPSRGPGSRRDSAMLVELRRLCGSRDPGQLFSQRELGELTGTSRDIVRAIERRACKKLWELMPAEVHRSYDLIQSLHSSNP